jgi:hypothetical protein
MQKHTERNQSTFFFWQSKLKKLQQLDFRFVRIAAYLYAYIWVRLLNREPNTLPRDKFHVQFFRPSLFVVPFKAEFLLLE